MRELERTYSRSERIVAKAKFTYWVYLREVLLAAVLGGILAVIWIFADQIEGLIKIEFLTEAVLKYILLGCAGAVLLAVLMEAVSRYRKEALITQEKFVARSGVVSLKNAQLPINEIKSVETKQMLFQRLLRYGNVTIITDAEKPLIVKWVVQPERFAQKITKQKTRTEKDENKAMRLTLAPTTKRNFGDEI